VTYIKELVVKKNYLKVSFLNLNRVALYKLMPLKLISKRTFIKLTNDLGDDYEKFHIWDLNEKQSLFSVRIQWRIILPKEM
jgi:hypothetical protein